MKAGWLTVLGVALFGIGAVPHSTMHLRLVKSEPAQDATVTAAPAAVHLWYSEEPQVKLTTVRLTGTDGRTVELKPVAVVEEDGRHLAAQVGTPLDAGAYTVAWRTLARDGHVVNGTFTFTLAPGQ